MSSFEQKFGELTKKEGHVEEADIAAIFDQAKPVEPEYLIGQWEGGSFDTVDDVEPIVLYDSAGARIWNKDYGKAQLRETKFRGVVSAAMIYDNFPIIDSFRYISHNVVIGGMDNKLISKEAGTYYFYLRRIVG
ncbi:uncharacterized protein NECHADRAFT_81297 [Fusarium vanettenii 77-13-4]|uniref:GXWXG domain-containing protein n=1 Tax=Fusarium vanettenii (strain ATCC MYA-4622 / CBS 123669 / FGSC 9596 / NRRL 45880 / 77-13-4) TaxID=660122 RepID=C7ZHT8_FUSV7|nr:uncharacterized protein NECHADRAFT_81297 [Fusarium vanettenii 77-13-4]EEU36494.1 hypothetical protein NECHADRAFT_81297 [Fusarium vanettenii 77-13-4]